jgi:hypothetical protein
MEMQLSQEHVTYLEGRGIDSETASRYGLYTVQRKDIGPAIVFQIKWMDRVVNRKYRGSPKTFRQDKDSVPAFFNGDVVRDASLADHPLVVTEGEFDTLAAVQAGFFRAVSVPNGADSNLERFPSIRDAVLDLPVQSAVIDGELVACDADGKHDFYSLMRRQGQLCVWCFDLLACNRKDLRQQPLEDRKEKLRALIVGADGHTLRFSDGFDDPEKLLAVADQMGLEGIVSKRRTAPYAAGINSGWIKVKTRTWREANRERYILFEKAFGKK